MCGNCRSLYSLFQDPNLPLILVCLFLFSLLVKPLSYLSWSRSRSRSTGHQCVVGLECFRPWIELRGDEGRTLRIRIETHTKDTLQTILYFVRHLTSWNVGTECTFGGSGGGEGFGRHSVDSDYCLTRGWVNNRTGLHLQCVTGT